MVALLSFEWLFQVQVMHHSHMIAVCCDVSYIAMLAVDKNVRKRKIGSTLVQKAFTATERYATDTKQKNLHAHVR